MSLAILLSLLMITSIPALAIQITDEKGITFIDYDEGAEWNNLISEISGVPNISDPFGVQEVIGVSTNVIGIPQPKFTHRSMGGGVQNRFSVGVEMNRFDPEISATYNITDQFAVQGIIGIPTEFQNFSGVKLMYRYVVGVKQNYYFFALGGVYTLYYADDGYESTGAGGAGGIGMEYSPNSFPDYLRYSIEIGQAGTSLPEEPSFLYVNFGFRVYF